MDAPERRIGGYTLRRLLGRGGMGEVHLAATPNGGLAAVKLIHSELARDPAFRRRFDREVAAARRVARFCTAPVLDAGIEGDVAYLVTEYVKGPDLAQAVREQGPLSASNLEALAVGIATALTAIHGAGVVHRNLKSSNVLLSPLGPRVIDFGIAQLVGVESLVSRAILGTPAFMAPEQVRGEPVTTAADVYAWGGVIAFAGTGRFPFGGGLPAEVLHRIVNDGPHLEGLDGPMRAIVEHAMAKDPARRPTAQDLLATLVGGAHAPSPATASQAVERAWTTIVPLPPTSAPPSRPPASASPFRHASSSRPTWPPSGASPVPSPTDTGPGQPPSRPGARRRWWPWAAGLVVALVAAGGAVVALQPPATPQWPYRADFGAWALGGSDGGRTERSGESYVLTANPGWRLWKSAPLADGPSGGVVVSARADLEEGSGEFGVWCGSAADRYEFGVNGSGTVSIVKRRAGQQGRMLHSQAAQVKRTGVRVVAQCVFRGSGGGAPVDR